MPRTANRSSIHRVIGIALRFGLACLASVMLHSFLFTASAQTARQVTLTDTGIVPATMYATKGQPVELHVVNQGNQVHNLVIPAFYIFTSNLQPGEDTRVKFTPDKTGTYPYYSDTGGKPEPGLRGSMTVQ